LRDVEKYNKKINVGGKMIETMILVVS